MHTMLSQGVLVLCILCIGAAGRLLPLEEHESLKRAVVCVGRGKLVPLKDKSVWYVLKRGALTCRAPSCSSANIRISTSYGP